MNLIIDAHLDLAWSALGWNRDLTEALSVLRQREAQMTDHRARGHAVVCLPEMRRGGVAVGLGTLLCRADPGKRPPDGFRRRDLDYATQELASAEARGQLEYYELLQARGEVSILRTSGELEKHWDSWETRREDDLPIGIIIAMEGADPIVSPKQADVWFERGLRCVGLAHYGKSAYAGGTGESIPLTSAGVELLREMSRLKMILDLTHCCDESFFDALNRFDGAVFASHNNCRALVPGVRQYSDEQIRLLVERGAVIGAAFDGWMLYPNWKVGQTDRSVIGLDAVADHIDRICQLAGNARHVGIGSDLDGGFGFEQCPTGVDSIADMQKLEAVLLSRGYRDHDVSAIFHGNWLRFFTQHLPA